MLNKFFHGLGVCFLLAALYSCSNVGVKYPSYVNKTTSASIEKPKHTINTKSSMEMGLNYLRARKCRKAVRYFSSMSDSFIADYCLSAAYGYCSMFKKSKSLLEKIENYAVSDRWKARVYASLGLLSMLNEKGRFRDYVTIAYAYDDKNELSRALMFKQNINKIEKKKYFDMIFSWCGEKNR